jgi:glycerol-3-phosphate dehydrogenase
VTNSLQSGMADLFIIGGGINGCGIARDAVGRGLTVLLAEQGDLAQATSSASTKLFHGGLRYLEYFEFRLVREALEERETLLVAMPHISWPMRFVLPIHPDMRFESDTPTSRLLARIMPWMQGRRPSWLIRLGLFLYDTLGGRKILPATRSLNLQKDPAGRPLRPGAYHDPHPGYPGRTDGRPLADHDRRAGRPSHPPCPRSGQCRWPMGQHHHRQCRRHQLDRGCASGARQPYRHPETL